MINIITPLTTTLIDLVDSNTSSSYSDVVQVLDTSPLVEHPAMMVIAYDAAHVGTYDVEYKIGFQQES